MYDIVPPTYSISRSNNMNDIETSLALFACELSIKHITELHR